MFRKGFKDIGVREMTKKIIAVIAVLIITLSGLTGCEQTSNFLGGSTEKEKNTVRSDEIYIPIEKIRTLNPIVSKDEDVYYVDKLIYQSLFDYDKNLTLVNVLADSYSYSADKTSVTIELKRGMHWQDGQEITAEDVKFTMDVIAAAAASGSTLYGDNISNVKGTKLDAGDPYQITVFFKDLQNISMDHFTFPIIAKHQFKSVDVARRIDTGFIPIGSGPYQVSDYNDFSHIILTGNENYLGGSVPGNTLNFQIMPEKKDAVNLMDVNNISITFAKDLDRDTIYTNKDVNVVNFPSNEVEFIGYNFGNPALKDPRVRKAVASAIDTKEIIESAYYKNGIENDNIYFPNFLGNSSKKTHNSYDITNAKKLLTGAGYYDRNGDGLLENTAGQTITINILVNSEDQSRVAAAQVIKAGLDQLPVQAAITSVDWNTYNSYLASGNYDIYLGGYQIKENYDLRFLLYTGLNRLGYSNIVLDGLLDKMESGLSQKDRQDTYSQIRSILDNDLPYFCLLYKTYGAIASPSMKGEIDPTFVNLYQGADKWYAMLEVTEKQTEEPAGNQDAY